MKTLAACAAVGIMVGLSLSTVAPAVAQSTLERLEQSIRQKVAARQARAAAENAPAGADRETGYLGALLDDHADRGRGVRVSEVRAGGPADKAGLKTNDLITAVAGIRTREMSSLADVLAVFKPGDEATLDILRGNEAMKIKVALGRRPAAAAPAATAPGSPPLIPEPPTAAPLEPPAAPLEPPAEGPQLAPPPKAAPPVPAPPAAGQPALVEQLQRRIEQLERRVTELEQKLAESRKAP